MNTQHLSDDQLLEQLYGLTAQDTHLDACAECQTRWSRMQAARERTVLPQPRDEWFRGQRREILNRVAEPVRGVRAVLVPATVALAVVAGLLITHPAPPAATPAPRAEAQLIEAGWFEDTYSATRQLEPLAASPIRELFTEGPVQ